MPIFEVAEYRARVAALKRLMADRGMDAMLVMSEANMNYLTGYDGYSEYVPQLALVVQDEDEPVLILREMDLECAYPTSYLSSERIVSYPESFIGTNSRTPWEPIAETVRRYTKSSRIGCELTARIYGMKAHAALTRALQVDDLIDASEVISLLKRVKSRSEIAFMEQAARIVDRAMAVGFNAIDVGVRESDVASAVTGALIAGTPEYPGSPCRMLCMPVGPVATAPHLKWTDASYKAQSQTNFEIGAFRHRYCCPLARTVFLGTPPDRLRYLHQAVQEGFLAAEAAMRPGNTCGDVDAAFRKAFDPYGIRKESRIGYSVGLDWSDGGASIQKDDPTVLVENMAFHLIVGIWEPGDGYVFSEAIRLTETGSARFSQTTRDLMVRN